MKIQSKIVAICLVCAFLSLSAGKNKKNTAFLIKNTTDARLYVAIYVHFFDNAISKIGGCKAIEGKKKCTLYRSQRIFELAVTKDRHLLKKEFLKDAEEYINLNRISLPETHNFIEVTQNSKEKIILKTGVEKEKLKISWCPDFAKYKITRKAIFNNRQFQKNEPLWLDKEF